MPPCGCFLDDFLFTFTIYSTFLFDRLYVFVKTSVCPTKHLLDNICSSVNSGFTIVLSKFFEFVNSNFKSFDNIFVDSIFLGTTSSSNISKKNLCCKELTIAYKTNGQNIILIFNRIIEKPIKIYDQIINQLKLLKLK